MSIKSQGGTAFKNLSLLQWSQGISALLFISCFIITTSLRISYPYELEWIEGASLSHVQRILANLSLYTEPSLEFVPYVYTPLYFYASALISFVVGINFFALRLVSVLSTLGLFWLIFRFVKRETGRNFHALLSVGLFAATYPLSSYWFDVARVDMLFVLLLFSGLYLLRFHNTLLSNFITIILLTLSYLTKQSALPLTLVVLIYTTVREWKRGCLLLTGLGLSIGGMNFIWDRISDGWYGFFTLHLPQEAAGYIRPQSIFDYFISDLFLPLCIALTVGIYFIMSKLRHRDWDKGLFYLVLLLGFVVCVLPGRVNAGGFPNNTIPVYVSIAILFGLGAHLLNQIDVTKQASTIRFLVINLILLIQMGLLVYNPLPHIPSANDALHTRNFINLLSQYPGDVFIPAHPYLAIAANKKEYAHICLIEDVTRFDKGPVRKKLLDELNEAYAQGRFSVIILDKWSGDRALLLYYHEVVGVLDSSTIFRVFAGLYLHPTTTLVPN